MVTRRNATFLLAIIGLILLVAGIQGTLGVLVAIVVDPRKVTTNPVGGTGGGSFE